MLLEPLWERISSPRGGVGRVFKHRVRFFKIFLNRRNGGCQRLHSRLYNQGFRKSNSRSWLPFVVYQQMHECQKSLIKIQLRLFGIWESKSDTECGRLQKHLRLVVMNLRPPYLKEGKQRRMVPKNSCHGKNLNSNDSRPGLLITLARVLYAHPSRVLHAKVTCVYAHLKEYFVPFLKSRRFKFSI